MAKLSCIPLSGKQKERMIYIYMMARTIFGEAGKVRETGLSVSLAVGASHGKLHSELKRHQRETLNQFRFTKHS